VQGDRRGQILVQVALHRLAHFADLRFEGFHVLEIGPLDVR
jgi:hypothetical protein